MYTFIKGMKLADYIFKRSWRLLCDFFGERMASRSSKGMKS